MYATIIGVLVLVAIPAYLKVEWQVREKKAVANLYSIYNAEKSYFLANNGTYSNQNSDLQKHVAYAITDGDWQYSVDISGTGASFTATATATIPGSTSKHVYIDQTGSTSKDF